MFSRPTYFSDDIFLYTREIVALLFKYIRDWFPKFAISNQIIKFFVNDFPLDFG